MNNLKNHIRTKRASLLGIVIILVAAMYFVDGYVSGFWKTLLMLFGINVIFAVSLNITNSWINFFSIGHGGIILAGIYFAAFSLSRLLSRTVLFISTFQNMFLTPNGPCCRLCW